MKFLRLTLSVIVISTAIVACDSQQEPVEPVQDTSQPSLKSEQVEKTVDDAVAKTTANQGEKEEDKNKKKPTLDLKITETDMKLSGDQPAIDSDPQTLPDMFEKGEERTKVSGNVFRDEENTDYMDVNAIEGAELNVEIKTD